MNTINAFNEYRMIRKTMTLIVCAGYICLFLYSYIYLISPIYSYLGDRYTEPVTRYFIIALFISILPIVWLPVSVKRPSHALNWIIYVAVYIPSCLIPLLILDKIKQAQFINYLLILCLCFSLCCVSAKIPLFRNNLNLKLSHKTYTLLIIMLFISGLIILICKFGVTAHLPSFSGVYVVREQFKNALGNNSSYGYVVHWFDLLSALFIAFGITMRNYRGMILVGILGEVYIYSITGYQSSALSILLIIGVSLAISINRNKYGQYVLLGLSVMIVFCAVLDWVFSIPNFTSLLVRRLLATPGMLTGYYFDYFSTHEKAHYAYSFLRYFFNYPYDKTPPYLLGTYYFGNSLSDENVNLFADGYANFGYFGMLLISVVYMTIVWFYDSISRRAPLLLSTLVLVVPGFSLVNGALPTVIVTHGLLLAILLMVLFPKDKYKVPHRRSEKPSPSDEAW